MFKEINFSKGVIIIIVFAWLTETLFKHVLPDIELNLQSVIQKTIYIYIFWKHSVSVKNELFFIWYSQYKKYIYLGRLWNCWLYFYNERND